jgi:hypothetical protein
MAKPLSETDCIMAETKGTFKEIFGFSPFLNFTMGVCKFTLSGVSDFVVKPGKIKYSLKVRETSSIIFAIIFPIKVSQKYEKVVFCSLISLIIPV